MDYGLVAFNRSEENIKQNLKLKYDNNFAHYIIKGVTNLNIFYVTTIKTAEVTFVTFKLVCNADCACEVFINDNLEYALNLAGSAEFCLKLNKTSKIEIKLITPENKTITLEAMLFGKFREAYPTSIQYFKNNKYHNIIFESDNQFNRVSASSLTELVSNFNSGSRPLLLNYVCGAATGSGFYYVKNNGKTSYITGVIPEIKLANFVVPTSVLGYDYSNNRLIVFELINNQIKVSTLSYSGEINHVKTFNLPSGIHVKKLFPLINNNNENVATGFVFCDVNSQFYLVLCNNDILANSSRNTLNCITLSVKGEFACGYINNGKYYIEINNACGVTEVVMQENNNSLVKVCENYSINTTHKILINNSNYLINFNGYMVEHNVT